jgi:hypothetical protein
LSEPKACPKARRQRLAAERVPAAAARQVFFAAF